MKHKSNHKPHKAKKHHKKGGKRKGLSGVAAVKQAAKKGMTEMATPAGVLVGLVAASVASNLLDKVKYLETDPAVTTFQAKSLLKPLILAGAGTGLILVTHKKSGAMAKLAYGAGFGLVGGGVFVGAKVVLKKSLVSGLGAPEEGKAALEATYYRNQAEDMAKMIEAGKFKPELPALKGHEGEDRLNGENVMTDMDWQNSDVIL